MLVFGGFCAGIDAARSGGWARGACCFLCGSDLIDGEMTHDRHVGCAVALAQAGLVFVEDDVEHPMQPVFDGPIGPRTAAAAASADNGAEAT